MITLLTHTYPGSRGKVATRCDIQILDGDISLSDPKACSECKKNPDRYPPACDEVCLKLHADNPLCILRFDNYLQQFYPLDKVPSNCDYLIFDEGVDIRKIAFCDLTCSTQENVEPNSGKYPEGKRSKCRTQMQTSLNTIAQDSLLATRIYSIPHRIAIFGWREYRKEVDSDRATSAMLGFGRTPSSMSNILEYEAMALTGNFKFIEVKYPSFYLWTESQQDISTYD